MLWLETCSEFWTDTLQPTDDAVAEFHKYYKPVLWTVMRPLWPRRCFITGVWLWREPHYRVEVVHLSAWWEWPPSHEHVWIEVGIGTQLRLMA